MRAVFLDRDGVICENRKDHVKNWNEFEFLPGVFDALRQLRGLGLPVFVISNQAIVNRGITNAATINDIHNRMRNVIQIQGGRIDGVFYCPHRNDEGCNCRKPGPGLLWQAANAHNIDLTQSYLVGDAETDIDAGQSVGCTSIMVLTGRGMEQLARCRAMNRQPDQTVFNIEAAVQEIITLERRKSVIKSYNQKQLHQAPQPVFASFAV